MPTYLRISPWKKVWGGVEVSFHTLINFFIRWRCMVMYTVRPLSLKESLWCLLARLGWFESCSGIVEKSLCLCRRLSAQYDWITYASRFYLRKSSSINHLHQHVMYVLYFDYYLITLRCLHYHHIVVNGMPPVRSY